MSGQRPENFYAAGVLLSEGGYRRSALDIARDFVRDDRDAPRLAELLNGYLRAPEGQIIAPFAFGGKQCLCEAGTEEWCRAVGCPRKPIARNEDQA